MKKSELKNLIKEELLKEINTQTIKRMEGLVAQSDLKKLEFVVVNILKDLTDDGFDFFDIKKYIFHKANYFLAK